MKLVSWNCNGVGSPNKVKSIKDLLKMEHTDIMMLQDTKVEENTIRALSRENWKKTEGIAVNSRGFS